MAERSDAPLADEGQPGAIPNDTPEGDIPSGLPEGVEEDTPLGQPDPDPTPEGEGHRQRGEAVQPGIARGEPDVSG